MRTPKTLLLAIGLSLMARVACAVPAQPGVKKQIRLADGREVTATLQGDELQSYYVLDDGSAVVRSSDGRYRPQTLEGLQTLRRAALMRGASLHGGRTADQRRAARLPRGRASRSAAFEGRKKGLVLLVNFADNRFAARNTPAYYQRYFNEPGFTEGGMTGSVYDYFLDQSYGRLQLDFDIAGPITLSHDMSYYGAPTTDDHDNLPHILEMVEEACRQVDAEVNFADYDWDGDGEVDQVYLVYAGYGQASGGSENTIWPHEYGLGDQAIRLDGVWVNTYACSNELNRDNSTTGIGTACHEFSHCLGLSDHYDTSGQGNPTPANWDLMASGSYNNNQCTPVGYSAFERWQSGWLEFTELDQPTAISGMKPIDQVPEAYILCNDNNPNEFYVLENRQPNKWNSFPDGHGLLVMHVDYDRDVFAYNMVNTDRSHLRMQVVAADGSAGGDYAGDTWPGITGKRQLTDSSTPRATVFTADRDGRRTLGKPLTNIREDSDGTLAFTALEGVMPKPVMQPFTDVTPTGFTAHWTPMDGALSYTVGLRQVLAAPATPAEAVRILEDFGQCVAASVGMSSVANRLDDYLNTPGFTGERCYKAPGGLQLGRNSSLGTLCTPELSEPLSGRVTILLGLLPAYSNALASANLSITTGGVTYQVGLSSTGALQYIPTEEGLMAETPFSIKVAATRNPVVLNALIVLDGVFSDAELSEWLSTLDAPAHVQWHAVSLPASTRLQAPRRAKGGTLSEFTTTATSYTFLGLDTRHNYYVSVRAHVAEGNSRWSNESRVDMPTAVRAPFAPFVPGGRAYDLSGRPASARRRGITVQAGRLIMQ